MTYDGGRCRVTPEGGQPAEAATPTAAWSALYGASQRGRVTAMCGARLFGLSDKRVLQLLAALPGANRCERFCGWPGERPPPPPLVRLHDAHLQYNLVNLDNRLSR